MAATAFCPERGLGPGLAPAVGPLDVPLGAAVDPAVLVDGNVAVV